MSIPIRPLAGLALALLLALLGGPASASAMESSVVVASRAMATRVSFAPTLQREAPTLLEAARPRIAVDADSVPPEPAPLAVVPAPEVPAPVPAPAPAPVAPAAPEARPTPVPAPAPDPAAAPAPGSLDEVIARHFGPVADQARRVAECESSMNPSAVSASNDHGLFQINAVHRPDFEAVTGRPWSDVYDPDANTAYAKWLYDRQGWRPWTCRHAA